MANAPRDRAAIKGFFADSRNDGPLPPMNRPPDAQPDYFFLKPYIAVLLRPAMAGSIVTSSRKTIFMIGGATSVVTPVIKITTA